uniref:Odorant receptor n=2 Tax=Holotrichia parallela TaxID=93412 RepID=A0AA49X758_HOLPA|nr:odorant receptor 13a [Holotrichia parallela]
MKNKEMNILRVSFRVLSFFRIFPKSEKLSLYDCLQQVFIFFNALMIGSVLHFYHNLRMDTISIDEGVEDFILILANVGFSLGISYFKYNHKNIRLLMDDLKTFDEFGFPPGTRSLSRKINHLTIGFTILGMVLYLQHFFYKVFYEESCAELNIKYDKNDICGLSSRFWLPFEISFSIKLFVQILDFFYVLWVGITCVLIGFVVGCAELIIIRVLHLKMMLKDALSSVNRANSKNLLITCIKYHSHIISLTHRYNECFGKFVMLFLMQTGPTIAVASFSIIIEPKISVMLHLSGWVVTLFTFCVSGQRLIDESSLISQTIYDTEWYELDISLRKHVILTLLQSQRPLRAKMWMISEASYMTFAKVIKMSYSIITLLNGTLTRKNDP